MTVAERCVAERLEALEQCSEEALDARPASVPDAACTL